MFCSSNGWPCLQCVFTAFIADGLVPRRRFSRNVTGSMWSGLTRLPLFYQIARGLYVADSLLDLAISMRQRLYGLAYTLLGGRSDDANDAVQDVMLNLLVRGAGRMPEKPESYLYQSVHNRSLRYAQGAVRRAVKEREYVQTLPSPPSLYDTVAARLELEQLGRALAALTPTPKEQEAFEAYMRGETLVTAKRVSLLRFRKRLREEMRR